jgi:RNA polymerase sigma-70 factor (sigma-E family)
MRVPSDLEAFCEQEYPRLVGLLDLYVGNLQTAEDLAQEALLRAVQRWKRVSALESPGGWVYRVAMNLANSKLRRRSVRLRALARAGRNDPVVHEDRDVAAQEAIRGAIRTLPSRQRQAVLMRYYLGLSSGEVGDHLGCSAEAVRSLVRRAVVSLRGELNEERLDEVEEERSDVSDC